MDKYFNFWYKIVPTEYKKLAYFLIIFNILLFTANLILAFKVLYPYGIFMGFILIILTAMPLGIAYGRLSKYIKK